MSWSSSARSGPRPPSSRSWARYFVARRRHRGESLFLLVVAVLNIVTVVFAAGLDHQTGLDSGLVVGGFLLDAFFVAAILVAVGTTELVRLAVGWLTATQGRERRRELERSLTPLLVAIVAVAVVAPSLVVHFGYADHRGPPLAGRYGQQVLAELPHGAVLLVWGAEYGMPVTYRQIVFHERSDVVVISGPEMLRGWYRDQIGRQLGVTPPAFTGDLGTYVTQLIAQLRATRPVALDMTALQQLAPLVGYRQRGLVADVVHGTGPDVAASLTPVTDLLQRNDQDGGVATTAYLHFPNHAVYFAHRARAHRARQAVRPEARPQRGHFGAHACARRRTARRPDQGGAGAARARGRATPATRSPRCSAAWNAAAVNRGREQRAVRSAGDAADLAVQPDGRGPADRRCVAEREQSSVAGREPVAVRARRRRDAPDRESQLLSRDVAECRGVAEGIDGAVRCREPVALARPRRRDPDDRVLGDPGRRSPVVGVAVGEDAAVGGDEPVAVAGRACWPCRRWVG